MPLKLPKALTRRRSAGIVLDDVEEPPAQHSFNVLDRDEVEDHVFSGGLQLKRKNEKKLPGSLDQNDQDHTRDHDNVRNIGAKWMNNHSATTVGASSSAHASNGSSYPSSLTSLEPLPDGLFTNDRPPSTPLPHSDALQSHEHKSTFSAWTDVKAFRFRSKVDESNESLLNEIKTKDDTLFVEQNTFNVGHTQNSRHPISQPRRNLEDEFDTRFQQQRNIDKVSSGVSIHNARSLSKSKSGTPIEAPNLDKTNVKHCQSHNSQDLDMCRTRSWETDESRGFLSVPAKIPHYERIPVEESDDGTLEISTKDATDMLYASQILEQQYGQNSNLEDHEQRTPSELEEQQLKNTAHAGVRNSLWNVSSTEDTSEMRTNVMNARMPPINHRTSTFMGVTTRAMTPAQFEEYKRERQSAHADDCKSLCSDATDTYDDEDEVERERELTRQRRKQEANMAVYRQQMLKMTGGIPPAPQFNLHEASRSTPNLSISFSTGGITGDNEGKSSDEDDEDIPLGILQAHGFPNKNRPPTQSVTPETARCLSSYPVPAGATRNDTAAGGGGSMPAFARNLPTDPYIGANLVKTGARESLAFTHIVTNESTPRNLGRPVQPPQGSEYAHPAASVMNLPPGGLVGVIATEEHARAMRSRSPNTNGPLLSASPATTPRPMSASPRIAAQDNNAYSPRSSAMLTQSPLSPTAQSQIQINQSMTQMMQVQMQWMQQMMAMQGLFAPSLGLGTNSPISTAPRPFLSPSNRRTPSSLKPVSMAVSTPSPSHFANDAQYMHNRGMSTLSVPLNVGGANDSFGMQSPLQLGPRDRRGYAASIAPSERSSEGQPSRYRPVTGISPSTVRFTIAPAIPGASPGEAVHREEGTVKSYGKLGTTSRPFNPPPGSTENEDEEDEAGWRQLKQEREERMEKRRARRRIENATEVLGVADVNIG